MNSENLCPYCKSSERCRQYGWDGAEKCVNFEKRDDLFDMTPLFEAAKKDSSEQIVMGSYNTEPYFSLWKDYKGYAVGTVVEDLLEPKTIQITGCERIILKDKSLDFSFELTKGQIEDFDEIIVNGIKFKRENKYDK